MTTKNSEAVITKNMEARREAFEAWYVGHAIAAGVKTTITDMVGMRGKEGEYRAYPVLHGKWIGYNAALDSICVDLSSVYAAEACCFRTNARVMHFSEVKQALIDAGVSFK